MKAVDPACGFELEVMNWIPGMSLAPGHALADMVKQLLARPASAAPPEEEPSGVDTPAALAEDGRAVIALPSSAMGGSQSRIVPFLKQGAGVVTTRGHVRWVVTEFGAVNLHGMTLRERGADPSPAVFGLQSFDHLIMPKLRARKAPRKPMRRERLAAHDRRGRIVRTRDFERIMLDGSAVAFVAFDEDQPNRRRSHGQANYRVQRPTPSEAHGDTPRTWRGRRP
mgnify:CR=1 FL=1